MERVDFVALDGVELNGILYKSKEKTKDVILAVHGMTSNCFKKRDTLISKEANKNNIDYFCFNNRGSELVRYLSKENEKILGGTSFEDVLEGYEDIIGAILKLKELKYENIYLQGHSLGCTKILYAYSQLKEEESDLLENIKGIILLSLVDIPTSLHVYLKERFDETVQIAEEKIQQGNIIEFMPKNSFIHPISPKTFLRYAKNNQDIDFINIEKDPSLEKLNNIDIPFFMRWGTENDMIIMSAPEYVRIVRESLQGKNCDIDYIQGADHGYHNKEKELAEQIMEFIKDEWLKID